MICDAADNVADNSLPVFPFSPNACDCSISMTTDMERSPTKKIKTGWLLSEISVPRPAVSTVNLKPADFIAFQMSFLGGAVKSAFVSREQDEYRVVIVVENRDLELNRKIFEHQRAIMQYYRQFRFDFYILPLMNRKLTDVMSPQGTQVL